MEAAAHWLTYNRFNQYSLLPSCHLMVFYCVSAAEEGRRELGPVREGGTSSADSTLRELPVHPGVAPPTAGLFLLGVSSAGPGEAGRLSAPDCKQSSEGPTLDTPAGASRLWPGGSGPKGRHESQLQAWAVFTGFSSRAEGTSEKDLLGCIRYHAALFFPLRIVFADDFLFFLQLCTFCLPSHLSSLLIQTCSTRTFVSPKAECEALSQTCA